MQFLKANETKHEFLLKIPKYSVCIFALIMIFIEIEATSVLTKFTASVGKTYKWELELESLQEISRMPKAKFFSEVHDKN
jgi:hypothetical protein